MPLREDQQEYEKSVGQDDSPFSISVPATPIPCLIVAYKLQLSLWKSDPKNFAFLLMRKAGNHSKNGLLP